MISCDCSLDVGDYEPWRCWSETIRKARTEHECCECYQKIAPGQRYEVTSGIDADGDPFRYKTCMPCAAIRERYCPDGWIPGELANTISQCLGFDYRKPIDEDDFEEVDDEDADHVAESRRRMEVTRG